MACPTVRRRVELSLTVQGTSITAPLISIPGPVYTFPSLLESFGRIEDLPGAQGFEYDSTTIGPNTFRADCDTLISSVHDALFKLKGDDAWLFYMGQLIPNPEPLAAVRGRDFISGLDYKFVYIYEDDVGTVAANKIVTKSVTDIEQEVTNTELIIDETYSGGRLTSAYYLESIEIAAVLNPFIKLQFNKIGEGTISPDGESWHLHNTGNVSLTADPASGWKRKRWDGDVTVITQTAREQFVFVQTSDLSVTVEFEEIVSHNVTLTTNPTPAGRAFGSFNNDLPDKDLPLVTAVQDGLGVGVNIKPVFGWRVLNWSNNVNSPNETGGNNQKVTNFISNIKQNVTVIANLVEVEFDFTIQHFGGENGSVKVNNQETLTFSGKIGDSFTLTFTPNVNFRVFGVFSAFGVSSPSGENGQPITLNFIIDQSSVSSNRNIVVDWRGNLYDVNISVASGNGTINPSGIIKVQHGTNLEVTANADPGWKVVSWTGTNILDLQGGNDAIVTNIATITGETTITVSFDLYQFTILGKVVGATGGTIFPTLAQGFLNSIISFEAIPSPGFFVSSWQNTVNDAKTGLVDVSVTNDVIVDNNKTVWVTFAEIAPPPPDNVIITTRVESGQGIIIGNGTFPRDPQGVTFVSARPVDGWRVVGWTNTTVNNKSGSNGEEVGNSVSLDISKEVTVTFEAVSFQVNGIVTGGNGIVCVKRNVGEPCVNTRQVNFNDTVTFTAEPDPGWVVISWTNTVNNLKTGSTGVPIDNTTVPVTGNMNVNVVFSQDFHTVIAIVGNGSGHGTVNPPIQIVGNGNNATITAQPNSGWFVSGWENTENNASVGLNGQQVINRVLNVTDDIIITVNFQEVGIVGTQFFLDVRIAPGHGQRGTVITQNGFVNANVQVALEASANTGWVIEKWDGADPGEFNIVTMNEDKIVTVFFKSVTDVVREQRLIQVEERGNGWVRPGSGPYDLLSKVIFTAGAFPGAKFIGWPGIDTDPDINFVGNTGHQIEVLVTGDKKIVAEFETIEDFAPTGENIFYCASQNYKINVISFDHTNLTGSSARYHYKISFYSDIEKNILVYSAFTSNDTRRWYIKGTGFNSFTPGGAVLAHGGQITVKYDIEVNPSQRLHQQRPIGLSESPLLCGVNYTVDIEIINADTAGVRLLKTMSLTIPCNDVEGGFWRENKDANNWVGSGQGKDDLKIASSGDQLLFPTISSNHFGYFLIVWQSRRNGKTSIYGAIWDSENDKLFSSGQGLYDQLYIPEGFKPHILKDQANNFYVSSNNRDTIFAYKCSLPLACSDEVLEERVFDDFCYPGFNTLLETDPSEIFIRIFKEDQSNSIVVDEDMAIPVVEKENIRLDVIGPPGVYAVRIRNSESEKWGDFINIDARLFENPNNQEIPTPDDDSIDAYFIGNNRFIVPCKMSLANGLRRICMQFLTFYGITKTVCLDIFVNLEVLSYRVEYYFDSSLTMPVDRFDGFPILTEQKNAEGLSLADTTSIYIKIIFSDPQIYENGELTFNVFQQGINDQRGLALSVLDIDKGTYTGSFEIRKHDGVYDRDGLGFINITFPNDPMNINTGCVLDQSDKFNLLLNAKDVPTFVDADPKSVLNKDKSGILNKVLDINSFKQFYNIDDVNFRFGDPKVFRTD